MQYSTSQTILGLVQAGATVTLIAPDYPGDREFDKSQPYAIIRWRGFGYLGALKRMWRAFRELRVNRYDCLLLMGYETELAYGVCSFLRRPVTKLFVLAAGTRLQLPNKSRLVTLVRDWLICRAYSHAKTVITISNAVRDTIVERMGKRLQIVKIPRPIDEDLWYRDPSPKGDLPFSLITVSRIYDQKNIQAVLRILRRLKNERCAITYYVVGDGDYVPALKKLANELGLEDEVVFTGVLAPEEIVALGSRVHVFVLLSIANNGIGETFGRVYLESAAMRVPSIAYESMGTRESVADQAGWLFSPGDEEGVFQQLLTLYRERDLLEERSARALAWYLEHFRKSVVAEKILRVLRS